MRKARRAANDPDLGGWAESYLDLYGWLVLLVVVACASGAMLLTFTYLRCGGDGGYDPAGYPHGFVCNATGAPNGPHGLGAWVSVCILVGTAPLFGAVTSAVSRARRNGHTLRNAFSASAVAAVACWLVAIVGAWSQGPGPGP